MPPLSLMIYDNTCNGRTGIFGLTHTWWVGGRLYDVLGRFDAYKGVSSWKEALEWLATTHPDREIGQIQYWGHGKWGNARIDEEVMDSTWLDRHPLLCRLEEIRERLSDDALWWFRTCETLGARPGHEFAQRWSDFFGAGVAGHTHIIWFWQSGLQRLQPGCTPDWSMEEGLKAGTIDHPREAYWSGPLRPKTITCLNGTPPKV